MIATPKYEGDGYEYEVEPLDQLAVTETMQIAYETTGGRISGDFWARVIINALSEPGFPAQTVAFHDNWLVRGGDGVVAISSEEQALNKATIDYILRTSEIQDLGVTYEQLGNVTLFFKRRNGRRVM